MLVVGHLYPRREAWVYESKSVVSMESWHLAIPTSVTLLSCVVALYVLFSAVGLVGGLSDLFWPVMGFLLLFNVGFWVFWLRRGNTSTQASLSTK